ncbi:MAG: DNA repair protein RecO [Burkholderiaceae bacterium]|nr:DNA repair protein RecO [Burkholderiaceae bacterium]
MKSDVLTAVVADNTPRPPVAGWRASSSVAPRPEPKRRGQETRVSGQTAYVLHRHMYKESSLILDVFSRDYGRVVLVAKGAKRPHSRLRHVLQSFQPLLLGWSGRTELRTLFSVEWMGGVAPLENAALFYGFYLNELLLKLLAREDPHPALFDHYVRALTRFTRSESPQAVLRQFELAVLKETGVAADLSVNRSNGQPIEPDEVYVVEPEGGPRPAQMGDTLPRVAGQTLIDMVNEDYGSAMTQTQSKLLMRSLLTYHLNGVPIQTRQILIDLLQL